MNGGVRANKNYKIVVIRKMSQTHSPRNTKTGSDSGDGLKLVGVTSAAVMRCCGMSETILNPVNIKVRKCRKIILHQPYRTTAEPASVVMDTYVEYPGKRSPGVRLVLTQNSNNPSKGSR